MRNLNSGVKASFGFVALPLVFRFTRAVNTLFKLSVLTY